MLFTFPSQYWFAIGLSVVFSLSGWSPIIQPEFLVFRPTQVPPLSSLLFAYRPLTVCGGAFHRLPLSIKNPLGGPITPARAETPPVWALPRSLAATGGIVFTFSSCRYLDVSVPCVRPPDNRGTGIASGGLPHSEIHGSRDICSSPWLIAACHVLLRLREPRHPPCALS